MGRYAMSSGLELHVERGRIRAILPSDNGLTIRTEHQTFTYPKAVVYPGFVDAHVHLLGLGKRLTTPSLYDANSEDECVALLQQAPVPANGWLQAMGWNQENWDVPDLPTMQSITAAFPRIPVVCTRVDGHAMWLNAEALRMAGITHPTGVLVDGEMDAVVHAIPSTSREEIEQQLVVASRAFARAGVTEVHDMDVAPATVGVTRELAESARLAVRVQSFVSAQNDEWVNAHMLPAGGERQRTVGVKMYADGALGSRGAALISNYEDTPHRGSVLLTVEQMEHKVLQAVQAGWWSIAIHAIGDAAVRNVLDAYERVREHPDGSDVILRIEHAQHVNSADVHRFSKLNVIASVQPTHAESDAQMAKSRLGEQRLQDAYRWKSLLDSGAQICFGTDAPIESESVLRTIDVAINGYAIPVQEHQTSECVSLEQAIDSVTSSAHASVGVDFRRGSLAIGMDADLVVFDRALPEAANGNPREVKVLATFTAGVLNTI